ACPLAFAPLVLMTGGCYKTPRFFPGSSAVEQPAVNRLVVCSNQTRGASFATARPALSSRGWGAPQHPFPRSLPSHFHLARWRYAALGPSRPCCERQVAPGGALARGAVRGLPFCRRPDLR